MEKYFYFDRRKTLEEIENQTWNDMSFKSSLVTQVDNLSKVPIQDLTAGNLRLLIGQNIGLNALIPIALELLEDNIFLDSELFAGDLLNAVKSIDKDFWSNNNSLKKDFEKLITDSINNLKSILDELS